MLEIAIEILLLLVSYLLGSIPNALIISKCCKGIDIRDYGSKNMGATNTFRVLGAKYGVLVFVLDALKASIVILLFKVGIFDLATYRHIPLITYGLAAILGHLFPIFANFHGGKGVACSAGVIISYAPLIALPTLLTFTIVVLITKYVSLGSILTVISALVYSIVIPLLLKQPLDIPLIVVVSIVCIIFIITHRKNIIRLIKHEENKISIK